jgi:Multivesicular body subunit 12
VLCCGCVHVFSCALPLFSCSLCAFFSSLSASHAYSSLRQFYRALQRTISGKLANLNRGSGGRDIYLCYLRQSDAPTTQRASLRPITGICVVHTDRGEMSPEGYQVITRTVSNQIANLNEGSGGRHVFLCVQRLPGAPPLLDLAVSMSHFKRKVKPPEGFAMLAHTAGGASGDLNAGSRGHFVCLCCRFAPAF